MTNTVNKVILIARVGSKTEPKFAPNGACIMNLSVATERKDANSKEITDWHPISVYGKLAEICRDYVNVGDNVYIEGELINSPYKKNGVEHKAYVIRANIVKNQSPKKDSGQR